jgi:hypothetical protein
VTSRRDVEQDIRDKIVREARGYPETIRKMQTETELAIGLLVRSAYGSADRLTAAVEQLQTRGPDCDRGAGAVAAGRPPGGGSGRAGEAAADEAPGCAGGRIALTLTRCGGYGGRAGSPSSRSTSRTRPGTGSGCCDCGSTASTSATTSSVEALAKVIDLSELVEADEPGQADEEGP